MNNHDKRICYPKSAYELFLKLYCRKRDSLSSEKNNMAAVKAWVTLNEDEKNTFIKKFIECKTKHKNQIANRLERLKPYMKKKHTKRPSEVDKSKCDSPACRDGDSIDLLLDGGTSKLEENIEAANKSNLNFGISEVSVLHEQHTNITNTKMDNVEEYEVPVILEPAPPDVRNSIDLFNMIKSKNGQSELEWSSLSIVEKMRYRKAVYQLKKDYLKNYKLYLESLPLKELFKYYHDFERDF